VAKAAMESGVAREAVDLVSYRARLEQTARELAQL